MLRLTFLGTSAAQPTIGRNLTGLAVRRERELFLVDCGEGTQRQMIRYGTGFDVAAIFFTHFHADHYLGAIGFLRTLSMQGRAEPIDLYGPKPGKKLLDVMLFTGTEKLAFEVRIHEVKAGRAGAARRLHARALRHPAQDRLRAAGRSWRTTGPACSTRRRRWRSACPTGRPSARCSAGRR